MARTDAARDEEHDRVAFLKRLNEYELMVYVDRVLEYHGSIDPGRGFPTDEQTTDTSGTNAPPR